jgi:hypothetical protein
MNPSSDSEILTYLKANASFLSSKLPVSKSFTYRIRGHKKHLDNLFDYWLNERNYNLERTHWKNSVQRFLENIYLSNNPRYISLEHMYIRLTGKNIVRPIQGEKSDFVEEKQDECHVCCNEINDHISCGHWVCKSCIINSGKETCPLCRKVVSLNIEEVKQMNIIKEKMKREKYEEERNQIISQQPNQQVRYRTVTTTQEDITRYLSFGLEMYRELHSREMGLNTLTSWCALYEMHNFSNDNQVYQQARRIIG